MSSTEKDQLFMGLAIELAHTAYENNEVPVGAVIIQRRNSEVLSAFSNQMARREAIFEAEVNAAMADGVITEDEADHIEDLRGRFKITEQHAKAIFDNIAEQQEFDEIIEEKTNKKREE